MKDFFRNLQFIFKPNFWFMNDPYDKDWDDEFNVLLDEHTFSNIDEYTAKLGDTKIWISNYPFACFKKGFVNKRPSRLTILRAKKLLDRDKLRAQIEGCVYPPRSRRIEELQRELIEIRETLDRLRASNHKNDIMGETIIKKHKFN
tara:strand:- start:7496 stop:7933 length:438 start_codon:yes stop_codon:yes gene_type:complete